MGSSYRAGLNRGYEPTAEAKLREAVRLINEVEEAWSENIGDDGQFDSAADDGAFREVLRISAGLIENELPPRPADGR